MVFVLLELSYRCVFSGSEKAFNCISTVVIFLVIGFFAKMCSGATVKAQGSFTLDIP